MDGVSAAASIIGIATVGVQISIKLITFSNQISTAPSRIRLIGNDVSLTSGVLQQLGDLMHQQQVPHDSTGTATTTTTTTTGTDDRERIAIFSQGGLLTTQASASTCKGIFEQLEEALKKASRQIRESGAAGSGGTTRKVVLSRAERLQFPFLQPKLDGLRGELRDARGTLLLILQVTTLAYSKKLAELKRPALLSPEEQADLVRSILAMHRKEVDAGGKDGGGDEEDGQGDREVDEDLPDEKAEGPAILPDEDHIVPPAGSGNVDGPHVLPGSGEEGQRKSLDLSDDEHQKEASNHHAAGIRSLSNSPSRKSATKRPPVCKFPWSSDGQHARQSRSRSRRGTRRIFSGRGRRRSRSSSIRPIIRVRSRSFDSDPVIIKEAWVVSPSVMPQKSAYRTYWFAERLPLTSDDVDEAYRRLKGKGKKSIMDQMMQLTNKEREFIDEWFNDELDKQRVKLFVVAMAREKVKSSDVVPSNLAQHRIRLIIERHPVDNFPRFAGPRRILDPGPGLIDLNRPTFIKFHRKFMEPAVLDRAELPWEWDHNDSRFMIIKRWLPETETDRLFQKTREFRREMGTRTSEETSAKRTSVPTYVRIHRKHIEPDVLDAFELPWEWDENDPAYVIVKRWIPEPEQDLIFEASRKAREPKGGSTKAKGPGIQSKWRPVFDFLRRKRAPGAAQVDPGLDRVRTSVDLSPARAHMRHRRRSSSPGDGPLALRARNAKRAEHEIRERVMWDGRRRADLEERARREAAAVRAKEKWELRRDRRRQAQGDGPTPAFVTRGHHPRLSTEEWPNTALRKPSSADVKLSSEAASDQTSMSDQAGSDQDGDDARQEANGQEIIDGLLERYTTLFRPPPSTDGEPEQKAADGDGVHAP